MNRDDDLESITRFCEVFKVNLVRSSYTSERGFRELIYFFSDNLGGYTIDGINGSLK
ncbi:hypothetical protein J4218_02170 [Candidatus Pacearchaeota archaeon]|nr:hypothetical protein [uncultured archaeon]AQS29160.1 hypothetical protein [uncultured archaeon]MBS3078904.1 hypothetical protein [Candidatus Pacearchaeota archaeon]